MPELTGKVEPVRFHTLDALRFFAFFKVFIFHLPLPIGLFPVFDFIRKDGGLGVMFFFVLSGFLITYLLITEKINHGNIDIKQFYLKRVLRIWPLYFIVIGLVYTALAFNYQIEGKGYPPDWRWSVFFLENYRSILYDAFSIAPLTIIWSLCVEEHFYLFWPWIIKKTNAKNLLITILGFISLGFISRTVYPYIFPENDTILFVDVFTNMDMLAIGGLLAYFVVFHYDNLKKHILETSYMAKWLYIVFVVSFILFHQQVWHTGPNSIFKPTIFALLFAGLLLIFMPHESKFKIHENSFLNKLGRISYGLYMYHVLCIIALKRVFSVFHLDIGEPLNAVLFSCTSLILSIGISIISWHFIEKPILQLRRLYK